MKTLVLTELLLYCNETDANVCKGLCQSVFCMLVIGSVCLLHELGHVVYIYPYVAIDCENEIN